MNKNTICTLLLSYSLSCNTPVKTSTNEEKAIYVPPECTKTLSLVHNIRDENWSLTCKDAEEKEVFYERNSFDKHWQKYEIIRQ